MGRGSLRALVAFMAAGALSVALAADRGSGHFRKGDKRVDVSHVVAVASDEDAAAERAETYVYLSDVPLDASRIAASFHPSRAAEQQLGDGAAGYVRICINADGEECGLYFSRNNPSASFNSSGYGEFKLQPAPRGRVAGRWVLSEPDEFFGETYDFDLVFDSAVIEPPGTPLPAGGGAPAQAYRAWTAAVAKGDLAALRRLSHNEYDAWRLRSEDDATVKTALKDLRDGTPLEPAFLRGRLHRDMAVVWVQGRDRDEILRRGRVHLQRVDGDWRFVEADLDQADED